MNDPIIQVEIMITINRHESYSSIFSAKCNSTRRCGHHSFIYYRAKD